MSPSFSIRWIPVRGDSMWPTLQDGDRAELAPFELPRQGEVVAVRFPRAIVIHRVLRADDGTLVLQGDNCAAPDPVISIADVLGRVERVERRGYLLDRAAWDRGPTRRGRLRVRVRNLRSILINLRKRGGAV